MKNTHQGLVLGVAIAMVMTLLLPDGAAYSLEEGVEASSDSLSVTTLADLLAEAERSNPAILSARAQADADAERSSQAGSLPDPVIGAAASNFRVDDPSLSSGPMAGVEIRFRQGIPFPGKLGRRRNLAKAETEVSREIVNAISTDVRARVKSRYWLLSGAEAIERITRDNVAVLEDLIDVANSRFAVGMGAQQDVLQVQAALAELQTQLLQRQQETRNAQRDLNVAIGRRAESPPIRTVPLQLKALSLDEVTVATSAAASNPDLRVRIARVVAAEKSVLEALRDRWPDFAISGGYRIRQEINNVSDGGDMFFVAIDMSLPVYAGAKQNRRVEETKSRLLSARYAESDVRLQVGLITRNLLDETSRALAQAILYRDEVIPQDRFALEAAVTDYSVANVEFVTVLNNWQALLRDEIALERLTATFGVRVAELEFVAGESLQ